MLSQQVVKIQRQQGLISQGNAIFDDLFELRLSIQDNPNQGIHAGDNKVTGMLEKHNGQMPFIHTWTEAVMICSVHLHVASLKDCRISICCICLCRHFHMCCNIFLLLELFMCGAPGIWCSTGYSRFCVMPVQCKERQLSWQLWLSVKLIFLATRQSSP